MGLFGSLLGSTPQGQAAGTALAVGGAIAGGIAAARSAAKQRQMIAKERNSNQNWYNQRYNEDSTQRADAQAAMTNMRNAMAERSAASAGTTAVMGGTSEASAAEKAAQNAALGQTTQQIVINGENRKDNIENQYRTRDAALAQEQLNTERQKAQSIQNATSQLSGTAGSIFGANNKVTQ